MQETPISTNELDPALFCNLPTEIVVKILNVAAALSSETALALCLVSSWTRHLAIPHLLSTIIFDEKRWSEARLLKFCRYMKSPLFDPPVADLKKADIMRNLWAPSKRAGDNILRACSDAKNIAVPGSCTTLIMFRGRVEPQRPQRMTILQSHEDTWNDWNKFILSGDHEYRLFDFGLLTHLHVTCPYMVSHIDPRYFPKNTLPSLTHLALTLPTRYKSVTHEFLTALDSRVEPLAAGLECLVLVFRDPDILLRSQSISQWLRKKRAVNQKVHLMHLNPKDLQSVWIKEAKGGETIWERAVQQTKKIESGAEGGVLDYFDHEDPEAVKLYNWRRDIENAFFRGAAYNSSDEACTTHSTFSALEGYENPNLQYLHATHLFNTMHRIASLSEDEVLFDTEFRFRERAKILLAKWREMSRRKRQSKSDQ